MTAYKVGYIVGSLAKTSINHKLALALARLAPKELELQEIPIRQLPLYSQDYDDDFPLAARAYKQAIASADALLFVTPEYNRSVPGALKNAIDWGSRPPGKNSFSRKPSAIIGTSPGALATAIAQQHLRIILNSVGTPPMVTPEAYIRFTPDLINADGLVKDESTDRFLRKFMAQFHAYIAERSPAPAAEIKSAAAS